MDYAVDKVFGRNKEEKNITIFIKSLSTDEGMRKKYSNFEKSD